MSPNWSGPQLALVTHRGVRFSQSEALQMQREIRVRRMLQHDESDLLALAADKYARQ